MSIVRAAVAVAVAFGGVLSLAFWIRGWISSIPDTIFGGIAGLSIVIVSILVYSLLSGIRPSNFRLKARQAFPRFAPTGPSAEQSAYLQDRTATASCIHLRVIERAMRDAGIAVRLLEISDYSPIVEAACRINQAGLRRLFQLPDSVYYREGYEPERSAYDNPRADIFCGVCLHTNRRQCDIAVVHPDESRPDTPWFPSPPSS